MLLFGPTDPLLFASCLVLGFVIWHRFPWAYTKALAGTIQEMANQPHGGGLVCSHTLTISDDGLTETTAVSSMTTAWGMIHPLHVGDGHSFIFLGPQMVHIVPRLTVTDGAYNELLDAVVELVSKNRT